MKLLRQKGDFMRRSCLLWSVRGMSSWPWQYVSFYKYAKLEKPQVIRNELVQKWSDLGVLGRVYVAEEGVNGQVAVPGGKEPAFITSLKEQDGLQDCFVNIGEKIDQSDPFPFEKLKVKVRSRIVNDGLEEPLNLLDRGDAASPEQWHKMIEERDEKTVILDCRNSYEHEIGRFDGSERVMVDVFRNTFDLLDERFKNIPPEEAQVMIYCTGGIRCEKVGAYLKSKLGLKNVTRLKGGIVSYIEFAKESGVTPTFKGKNYVFDERSFHKGSIQATEDVLGKCLFCGTPHDNHSKCANTACGRTQLQCPTCSVQMKGACSDACKEAVEVMAELDEEGKRQYRKENSKRFKPILQNSINRYGLIAGPLLNEQSQQRSLFTWTGTASHEQVESYAERSSSSCSDPNRELMLQSIRKETESSLDRPHMISSALQGRLLRFLVAATQAKRVLEVGTFSGYSTLCMLDALPSDGVLLTCDVDEKPLSIAKRYLSNDSRATVLLEDGVELLRRTEKAFDFIYIDANKIAYQNYYNLILERSLLSEGGIMVFDNTLFKGSVICPHKNQRIANAIARFNEEIVKDSRTTTICLPLWDGVTCVTLSPWRASQPFPSSTPSKSAGCGLS